MSYLFDGTDDTMVNTAAPKAAAPISMACWIKPDIDTATVTAVEIGTNGLDNNRFTLYANGAAAGDPITAQARATGSASASTTTGFQVGVWHHAAAVFASSTSRAAYIDGGSKGTNATSASPAGSNRTRIGSSAIPDKYFDGRIAEAAVWGVALSDAEVAQLAAGALATSVQAGNLLAYWPLEANAEDAVGAFDLTVTGATLDADHPAVGDVETAYLLGGLGRTTDGKLVLTTGGTAQAHRTQGLLVDASGDVQVATSGTTVGRVNGWEVDTNGKLLVATTGTVADRINGLAVNSSGRVLVDTGAVSHWENGLARTSAGKLAVQINSG